MPISGKPKYQVGSRGVEYRKQDKPIDTAKSHLFKLQVSMGLLLNMRPQQTNLKALYHIDFAFLSTFAELHTAWFSIEAHSLNDSPSFGHIVIANVA